jgi:3-oxoadipate enol-lactonase
MQFATINGCRLAYRDQGRQHPKTLLLIHGFPFDHRMWRAQLAGLSAEMRVIAPDLRGAGASEVPPGPYDMDQYADDLLMLLDHLDVARAVVAGLSMGGYIAFALWRRHPERVQAFTLMDTRAKPDSSQGREARNAAAIRVRQDGAAAYADEMLPKLLTPGSLADPRIGEPVRDMMAAQPVNGIVAALGAMRDRPDSRPTLATITVPTLVVVGEQDTITPPGDAEAMAAGIRDARVEVIPGAAHLSPLEKPRRVNPLLRDFIASL